MQDTYPSRYLVLWPAAQRSVCLSLLLCAQYLLQCLWLPDHGVVRYTPSRSRQRCWIFQDTLRWTGFLAWCYRNLPLPDVVQVADTSVHQSRTWPFWWSLWGSARHRLSRKRAIHGSFLAFSSVGLCTDLVQVSSTSVSSPHVYINIFVEYSWFKQRHWISSRGHRMWDCDPHFILKCAADVTAILVLCSHVFSDPLNRWHVLLCLLVVTTVKCLAFQVRTVSLELGGTVVLIVVATLGSATSSAASLSSSTSRASSALEESSCVVLWNLFW